VWTSGQSQPVGQQTAGSGLGLFRIRSEARRGFAKRRQQGRRVPLPIPFEVVVAEGGGVCALLLPETHRWFVAAAVAAAWPTERGKMEVDLS
jgi:hypothetical protein